MSGDGNTGRGKGKASETTAGAVVSSGDEPYGMLLDLRETVAKKAGTIPVAVAARVIEVLDRVDNALDLCTWVSSTKEEIEAALLGQLPPDHPLTISVGAQADAPKELESRGGAKS